jgi:hypothetical protein
LIQLQRLGQASLGSSALGDVMDDSPEIPNGADGVANGFDIQIPGFCLPNGLGDLEATTRVGGDGRGPYE